ncbi:MAG: hypothetical protein ABII13_02755 [Patescibacteria group bacterium]|nr:hypothetical protein [Patescibacteria group bacterium]MBU2509586.1 hypothetical protein [Patescibacteria group bacterium]
MESTSLLVGVWVPANLRAIRRDEPPEMDVRRVRFWHNDEACLMAEVEWTSLGILSHNLFNLLCQEFIAYVNS